MAAIRPHSLDEYMELDEDKAMTLPIAIFALAKWREVQAEMRREVHG